MFVIKTRVGPSSIHGTGVFANESVASGAVIWRYDPIFDQTFSDEDFEGAEPVVQTFLKEYAYRAVDLAGSWVLSGDHARFLNHSDKPNTVERPLVSLAAVDIAAGEEITCNYAAFCDGWTIADFGAEVVSSHAMLPHRNLHTRIQRAEHGVGVFAIHEIPAGVTLFEGDNGTTVRVPLSVVEEIADRGRTAIVPRLLPPGRQGPCCA